MVLERISLLRNIGPFHSVDAGNRISLTKLSLIYAENGRGKTTIAAILRSLSTGDVRLINDRQRLGAQHPPHIVLTVSGKPVVFEQGDWSSLLPRVAIFDDAFVAANVCSGIEIESMHRQNLHELILGAQGVELNTTLQGRVARIEQHNKDLRTKQGAIPAAARGALSVDAFCAVAEDPNIDSKIQKAERNLSAARSAAPIQQQATFAPLSLPGFDTATLTALLARNLPDLEADAATRVRAHIQSLGRGGESWIGDGMSHVVRASEGHDYTVCPFCAQDLRNSPLIQHYQVYFSEAYKELKTTIREVSQGINMTLGGDVPAAFERAVRVAVQNREFWRTFIDVPDIDVDTAAIARAWAAARDEVLTVLRAKAAAPLESVEPSPETIAAIDAYGIHRAAIADLSTALQSCNAAIARVKEQTAATNVAALTGDLAKLTVIKARYEASTVALCSDYLNEKSAKTKTEGLRDQARAALDHYRQNIFPAYQDAINQYLQRFTAGFRLESMGPVSTRGGSSATYNVLINTVAVALNAADGPSFRNTLSAGDRNTLALAFFFASLDQDPQLAQKIVVIDDPITSLDEHRRVTTVQEMRELYNRVTQMVVLSHSKAFLCALWEDADKTARSAMRINHVGDGSTLDVWPVQQDCITEHDRRHAQVTEYIQAANPATERAVAAALRPILEAFMRVAYPAYFPPGMWLGGFIQTCQQSHGAPNEILTVDDASELQRLLNYANTFHHDTNPVWETTSISDQELRDFARRTLQFTSLH